MSSTVRIKIITFRSLSPSASSSSSCSYQRVGPLVDPFRSHTTKSLFNGLPWFLLSFGLLFFIDLGNLLRGI
jgi:hypothetical protein